MTISDKTANENDIDKIFGTKFILVINIFFCVMKSWSEMNSINNNGRWNLHGEKKTLLFFRKVNYYYYIESSLR